MTEQLAGRSVLFPIPRYTHPEASRIRHRRQLDQTVSRVTEENQFMRQTIFSALEQTPINSSQLIAGLKIKPLIKFLFEYPQGGGGWEGLTLEEHTMKVLTQSQKYIRRDEWTSELLSFEEFHMMLALHDIGKPLSVEFTGLSRDQKVYTPAIFQGVLEALAIDPQKITLMKSLVGSDILSAFIRRQDIPLEEIAQQLTAAAESVEANPKEYAKLRRLYQLCDSSSYTLDAVNGEYSHDDCFTFGKTNDKGQPIIEYAPDLEEQWQQLLRLL